MEAPDTARAQATTQMVAGEADDVTLAEVRHQLTP